MKKASKKEAIREMMTEMIAGKEASGGVYSKWFVIKALLLPWGVFLKSKFVYRFFGGIGIPKANQIEALPFEKSFFAAAYLDGVKTTLLSDGVLNSLIIPIFININ